MTSGRIFFFINKCELYIIVKKKEATLGGLDTFCIWESEREKGEEKNRKNKLYLLTFRVGNAIPTEGSSALGSVNAVTAALVPPSKEKHSPNSSPVLRSPRRIPRCRFTSLLSNCMGRG